MQSHGHGFEPRTELLRTRQNVTSSVFHRLLLGRIRSLSQNTHSQISHPNTYDRSQQLFEEAMCVTCEECGAFCSATACLTLVILLLANWGMVLVRVDEIGDSHSAALKLVVANEELMWSHMKADLMDDMAKNTTAIAGDVADIEAMAGNMALLKHTLHLRGSNKTDNHPAVPPAGNSNSNTTDVIIDKPTNSTTTTNSAEMIAARAVQTDLAITT
ncbi:unnamed protein product [Vitrella brassicaformis CCMP3155]|uniref:Uncharacterized protein n=2 Tax=Vitrella brassicaformis TaxID=1169539 RepID=A0A0G4H2Q2_VITBC|nr:unnamed protein product [Vitrella brassicaformis CCMP3155]|eukprot:CEM37956.1 unnamed protein product [Vitrella brassicaformis CCMP3155]